MLYDNIKNNLTQEQLKNLNILFYQNGGQVGSIIKDKKGVYRRINSDGTRTQVVKTRQGWLQPGTFIQINGEPHKRRVNYDGTLTSYNNGRPVDVQYKNGKTYYQGNEVDSNTGTFKDNNGYIKKLVATGADVSNWQTPVQDVDSNGNPIKHTYIGGTTAQSREKYWDQAPIIKHATDSIAREYGISPTLLRNRLNHEGFVDDQIRLLNGIHKDLKQELLSDGVYPTGYHLFKTTYPPESGFGIFGLDDAGTYIEQGKVFPKDEDYTKGWAENEHGRYVHFASGKKVVDNIGLTAATLKFFVDKAKKDFPGESMDVINEIANIYYNWGPYSNKNRVYKEALRRIGK